MKIDDLVPKPPQGKIFMWLSLISVVLIIVFVYDAYWGRGDFFGLAKTKTTSTTNLITPNATTGTKTNE
ncbi:MAG: hypothetical protein PHP31_07620 [Lentimicrobiaceae bacterium]|nr:hypothetical protein [Lentimicrobiaceae bacterium]